MIYKFKVSFLSQLFSIVKNTIFLLNNFLINIFTIIIIILNILIIIIIFITIIIIIVIIFFLFIIIIINDILYPLCPQKDSRNALTSLICKVTRESFSHMLTMPCGRVP